MKSGELKDVSKQIPILHNHNPSEPIGKISFINDKYLDLLTTNKYTLAPAYRILEVGENGEAIEVELLEISLVPTP